MSRLKYMRVLVFFDIPTKTKANRQDASSFRKFLNSEGYSMMQYSVYYKICNGIDSANRSVAKLQKQVPHQGNIRAIIITEKQWGDMYLFLGTPTKQELKITSEQISIF